MQIPTAEDLEVTSLVLCYCKGSCQPIGADGADEEVVEVRAELEKIGPEAPSISPVQCCLLRESDVSCCCCSLK